MTRGAGAPGRSGFEALIYTDCRPGQGLQGTAGLQFQARSAGAEQPAMNLVETNLLYEAPANWMGERRPADRYPPSLAHAYDGGVYATGAGVYLGREANGNREGNQLTHAVVTDNPDAYGPVRPAQLFGASFWTRQPARGTECVPPGENWEPGPLDANHARELVGAAPDGRDLLAALVTVLGRLDAPDAPRVLFVCPDPALVLGWLTAATLLLPQRVALTIGFKIFTTRPMYANQPVLAVHPQWQTGHPAVANDEGFVVVDLVHGKWTPVEVDPVAARWADLFLTGDPYDVVDAVELAAGTGLPAEQAITVAAVAVLRRPPTAREAEPLARWLRDGPADQVRDYGGLVLETLCAGIGNWPTPALLLLDEVARRGYGAEADGAVWAADRVAAVRRALIAAELREATETGQVRPGPLAPLPSRVWTGAHHQAAERQLTEALARADPTAFEALLRLTRRAGLTVEPAAVLAAAHAFAAHWAEHPEHRYDPADWPGGEFLVDLRDDVLRHLVAADPGRADAIGDAWWPILEPRIEAIETPLDEAVLAAAVRHLPPSQRHELVDNFLRGAVRGGPRTVERLTSVLFRRTPADPYELELLARMAPPGTVLPARVVAGLREALLTADRLPTAELALARQMSRRGLLRPDPRLGALLDADRAVEELLAVLTRTRRADAGLRSRLAGLPPSVVRTHDTELISALLVNRHPAVVRAYLPPLSELATPYTRRLRALVRRPGEPWHAVTAFLIVADPQALPDLDPDDRAELSRTVRRWLARADEERLAAATAQVAALRHRQLAHRWQREAADARKPGLLSRTWHRISHRGGRR